MKFELKNMRIRISDEELIEDLRRVASLLGKNSLKMRDYTKENGAKFSVNVVTKRFGNWAEVMSKVGLKGEKSLKGMEFGEKKIKEEVLLEDIKRVAGLICKTDLSIKDYEKHGQFTAFTMHARFGSWNNAKVKANLLVTNKRDIPDELLFKNLLNLWTQLGRQPKYGEVVAPASEFNGSTYARRFGSWTIALESFIEFMNNEQIEISDVDSRNRAEQPISAIDTPPKISIEKTSNALVLKAKKKRTSRTINLRMRWFVLKRDNFSCKKCGRSPAKDPSVELHIDHIQPWSKGGETELVNLETLCQSCNLGKSNLVNENDL
jgi:hypothetical protein